jgi:hypothetical protein
MDISIRFWGGKHITLSAQDTGTVMESDITNADGIVDEEWLYNLEYIAKEIRKHQEERREKMYREK